MGDDVIKNATKVVDQHMKKSGLSGHIPTEAEGGYHMLSRVEVWWLNARAIHWPFIGHRFSPPFIRKRPGMYCKRCNQKK